MQLGNVYNSWNFQILAKVFDTQAPRNKLTSLWKDRRNQRLFVIWCCFCSIVEDNFWILEQQYDFIRWQGVHFRILARWLTGSELEMGLIRDKVFISCTLTLHYLWKRLLLRGRTRIHEERNMKYMVQRPTKQWLISRGYPSSSFCTSFLSKTMRSDLKFTEFRSSHFCSERKKKSPRQVWMNLSLNYLWVFLLSIFKQSSFLGCLPRVHAQRASHASYVSSGLLTDCVQHRSAHLVDHHRHRASAFRRSARDIYHRLQYSVSHKLFLIVLVSFVSIEPWIHIAQYFSS